MITRRPVAAPHSNPLPSLDDLKSQDGDAVFPEAPPVTPAVGHAPGVVAAVALASVVGVGAAVDIEGPTCAPQRSDELSRHGREAVTAARQGNAQRALREVGLAMGWLRHGSTTSTTHDPVDPGLRAPGEAMAVEPAPIIPQETPQSLGAEAPVGPGPRDPYPHRPHTTTVPTPQHEPMQARGRVRIVRPESPHPRARPSGGAIAVEPFKP